MWVDEDDVSYPGARCSPCSKSQVLIEAAAGVGSTACSGEGGCRGCESVLGVGRGRGGVL